MSGDYDKNIDHGISEYLNKTLQNTLDEGSYFTLNQQSTVALDILPKINPDTCLPDPSNNSSSQSSRSDTTLFAVLNKCRTISGKRILIKWLQNPLISLDKIQTRLDIVKHLVDNIELRTICYDEYLRKSSDLMRLSFKVSKESCGLNELVSIYKACKSMLKLKPTFRQSVTESGCQPPDSIVRLIDWINECCENLKDFREILEKSVDMDNTDDAGDLMVKPDSNEDIARVSLEMSDLCKRAKGCMTSVANDIGLESGKTIKLEIDSVKGFALKVTKVHEQSIRGNPDYEQVNLVKKDGYRFTNKQLTKLSTKYIGAKDEYNSLAKYIIVDIIKDACIFESEVQEFAVAVSMLDVFVSLAVTAHQNNYIKPLVLDSEAGRLTFERLRHPCLENQPDIENYVPNDLAMSKHSKKFYVITGPNMGGKSTFIKSIGLGILMAQCGSFIPADDARVSIVDGIYTRVGAGDRQSEGISTFMEEMLDMSTILNSATENSLVIIDELGRGTSTFDGFGLAWSISLHLATNLKSYTLFATHFHELTEMEEEIASVGNLHVRAICQDDKLIMMYNVCDGICDESYGINVARYTEFPAHVVSAAERKLKQFEEVQGFNDKKELRSFIKETIKEYMVRREPNE